MASKRQKYYTKNKLENIEKSTCLQHYKEMPTLPRRKGSNNFLCPTKEITKHKIRNNFQMQT